MLQNSNKRKLLKKSLTSNQNLRPNMSRENPDVLMDGKMKNLMDNMDTYQQRMEDKNDLEQGIIRNKYTRKIVGKIQKI